ncbi:hypothetical protein CTI12_AA254350 [Artemisia annua]|uniref:RNase H type-1 domain-containing protein n=1 Tax=Artemisia annua TaxID=35608 RepID=A0A2U1NLP6_ARTAN|nr:hypothetical protein CTI12_AA254350 [Artemisia annua]
MTKVLYHIRALFLNIRRLCLLFDSCTCSFVRREGNKVAHELARLALTDNVDVLYDGYVPLSVQALVQHDHRSDFSFSIPPSDWRLLISPMPSGFCSLSDDDDAVFGAMFSVEINERPEI